MKQYKHIVIPISLLFYFFICISTLGQSYTSIDINYKGNAQYNQQNYTSALLYYNQAIQYDTNYTEAYINRADTKKELHDYKGSLIDYTKAIYLDTNNKYIYYKRGLTKQLIKDDSGAIIDLNKAIFLDPYYAKAYYARGIIRMHLKDNKNAIADFIIAIEKDNGYNLNIVDAYKNLADANKAIGDSSNYLHNLHIYQSLQNHSYHSYTNLY